VEFAAFFFLRISCGSIVYRVAWQPFVRRLLSRVSRTFGRIARIPGPEFLVASFFTMADDSRPAARDADHPVGLTESSSDSSTTVAPAHDSTANGAAHVNGQAAANADAVAKNGAPDEKAAAAGQASDKPAEREAERTKLETTVIMLSLCSALFLAALDITIVTVAVPTIIEEFNSPSGYTWIGSAYLLASSAGAPVWGKISDIWGRKPILLLAVAVFWVGSVLSATSVNIAMLIAARAIQGIGGGGIVILVNICECSWPSRTASPSPQFNARCVHFVGTV
jgi:hypothetical protein